MGLAALSCVGRRGEVPVAGWWIHAIGLLLDVGSSFAQVDLPQSGWSGSAVRLAAPAWTPAFRPPRIGVVTRPWPTLPWIRAACPATSGAFVAVHATHASLAFAAG